jgi:AmiR/NasT family two-component response regulator
MAHHRIYVIWSNPIFRDSLRMILKHSQIEWVGCEPDFGKALEEIVNLTPDTIIVEISEQFTLANLIQGLEQEESELQIIGMNMENNIVTLYHRESYSVVHEDELLQIILNATKIGGIV